MKEHQSIMSVLRFNQHRQQQYIQHEQIGEEEGGLFAARGTSPQADASGGFVAQCVEAGSGQWPGNREANVLLTLLDECRGKLVTKITTQVEVHAKQAAIRVKFLGDNLLSNFNKLSRDHQAGDKQTIWRAVGIYESPYKAVVQLKQKLNALQVEYNKSRSLLAGIEDLIHVPLIASQIQDLKEICAKLVAQMKVLKGFIERVNSALAQERPDPSIIGGVLRQQEEVQRALAGLKDEMVQVTQHLEQYVGSNGDGLIAKIVNLNLKVMKVNGLLQQEEPSSIANITHLMQQVQAAKEDLASHDQHDEVRQQQGVAEAITSADRRAQHLLGELELNHRMLVADERISGLLSRGSSSGSTTTAVSAVGSGDESSRYAVASFDEMFSLSEVAQDLVRLASASGRQPQTHAVGSVLAEAKQHLELQIRAKAGEQKNALQLKVTQGIDKLRVFDFRSIEEAKSAQREMEGLLVEVAQFNEGCRANEGALQAFCVPEEAQLREAIANFEGKVNTSERAEVSLRKLLQGVGAALNAAAPDLQEKLKKSSRLTDLRAEITEASKQVLSEELRAQSAEQIALIEQEEVQLKVAIRQKQEQVQQQIGDIRGTLTSKLDILAGHIDGDILNERILAGDETIFAEVGALHGQLSLLEQAAAQDGGDGVVAAAITAEQAETQIARLQEGVRKKRTGLQSKLQAELSNGISEHISGLEVATSGLNGANGVKVARERLAAATQYITKTVQVKGKYLGEVETEVVARETEELMRAVKELEEEIVFKEEGEQELQHQLTNKIAAHLVALEEAGGEALAGDNGVEQAKAILEEVAQYLQTVDAKVQQLGEGGQGAVSAKVAQLRQTFGALNEKVNARELAEKKLLARLTHTIERHSQSLTEIREEDLNSSAAIAAAQERLDAASEFLATINDSVQPLNKVRQTSVEEQAEVLRQEVASLGSKIAAKEEQLAAEQAKHEAEEAAAIEEKRALAEAEAAAALKAKKVAQEQQTVAQAKEQLDALFVRARQVSEDDESTLSDLVLVNTNTSLTPGGVRATVDGLNNEESIPNGELRAELHQAIAEFDTSLSEGGDSSIKSKLQAKLSARLEEVSQAVVKAWQAAEALNPERAAAKATSPSSASPTNASGGDISAASGGTTGSAVVVQRLKQSIEQNDHLLQEIKAAIPNAKDADLHGRLGEIQSKLTQANELLKAKSLLVQCYMAKSRDTIVDKTGTGFELQSSCNLEPLSLQVQGFLDKMQQSSSGVPQQATHQSAALIRSIATLRQFVAELQVNVRLQKHAIQLTALLNVALQPVQAHISVPARRVVLRMINMLGIKISSEAHREIGLLGVQMATPSSSAIAQGITTGSLYVHYWLLMYRVHNSSNAEAVLPEMVSGLLYGGRLTTKDRPTSGYQNEKFIQVQLDVAALLKVAAQHDFATINDMLQIANNLLTSDEPELKVLGDMLFCYVQRVALTKKTDEKTLENYVYDLIATLHTHKDPMRQIALIFNAYIDQAGVGKKIANVNSVREHFATHQALLSQPREGGQEFDVIFVMLNRALEYFINMPESRSKK